MENASKALLIAGAILLVIAIIAIGMTIYQSSQEAIQGGIGQIDAMTISTHNRMFDGLSDGTEVSGDAIKELIIKIINNNKSAKAALKVKVYVADGTDDKLSAIKLGKITLTSEYKIDELIYDANGAITAIRCKALASTVAP